MKKIACVYTGMGALTGIIENAFTNAIGGATYNHICDSGLIRDIIAENGSSAVINDRIYSLLDAAAKTNPDILVCTCSSIGEVAEAYAKENPKANVLRIDYPMAKQAVERCSRIAVIATLPTTVEPSSRLVKRLAQERGKEVNVITGTCEGAYDAMIAGKMQDATAIVVDTVRRLCVGKADIILLAQASMANFAEAIREAVGDMPILNSPETCAQYLKEIL